MSTSFRTYRAIKQALMQALKVRSQSHQERHVITLALLICGIVGSRQVQFAKVTEQVPLPGRKNESTITRFRRWVKHPSVKTEWLFAPFARVLLETLAATPLTCILDASEVGRGCIALMASVVYRGRALPVAWLMVKGKKGHLPQDLHCQVVRQLQQLVPPNTTLTLVGDGEFDGVLLQDAFRQAGWNWVCRTASNTIVTAQRNRFHMSDIPLRKGEVVAIEQAQVTEARFGPVSVIGWWEDRYDEPIYLISSFSEPEEALRCYRLRFRIETMFADHKSRGFHLHKSHLAEPERLERLLIGTSLAYFWVLAVGVFAQQQGWVKSFHRSDRCDLSLFQLGLRAITFAVRERKSLPISFLPTKPR